jgi:hypothetical protein
MNEALLDNWESTKLPKPCTFTAAQNPMNYRNMHPTGKVYAVDPVDRSPVENVDSENDESFAFFDLKFFSDHLNITAVSRFRVNCSYF